MSYGGSKYTRQRRSVRDERHVRQRTSANRGNLVHVDDNCYGVVVLDADVYLGLRCTACGANTTTGSMCVEVAR